MTGKWTTLERKENHAERKLKTFNKVMQDATIENFHSSFMLKRGKLNTILKDISY